MPSRRTYTQETIDAIARRFDAAPPAPAAATYSTPALVLKLGPKIHAMTENGYTWDAIAALMADEGVTVSSRALRKYFSQNQDRKKTKRRTNGAQSTDAPKTNPNPNSSSTRCESVTPTSPSELAAKDDEWDALERVAVQQKDDSPAMAPPPARPSGMLPRSPAAPGMNATVAGARRSSVVVRPDTEEI